MSRITFSAAAARAAAMNDESEEEEEPGEEIESAPPLKIGEEREISASGLRKKLIKAGIHWETPAFGDEVTGNSSFSYWRTSSNLINSNFQSISSAFSRMERTSIPGRTDGNL